MRTVGLVDITTRTDLFNNSGSVGIMAAAMEPSRRASNMAARSAAMPHDERRQPGYQGAPASSADCFAGVQYYFTGRYLQNTVGIENPTPAYNAIHDFSQQEKGFAYMSTFVDPTTRVSLIAGTATTRFRFPMFPAQPVGQ
jgi:hypothetical protein